MFGWTLEYFSANLPVNWKINWFLFLLCNRLFLQGLKQFGKGDWRSISRNVVITRTPTQVASHAQKYFLRQHSGKKERKRSSIHDITTVESTPVAVPAEQNCVSPPANPPQQIHMFQHLNAPPPHMNMGSNHGGPVGYQNYYQMWHLPP